MGKEKSGLPSGSCCEKLCGTDYRLLKSIVSQVLPEPDCDKTTSILLKHYGSIGGLFRASYMDIKEHARVPQRVLEEINRTNRLMQAIIRSKIENKPLLDDYSSVKEYCGSFLKTERREQFHALFLDKDYHLLKHECLQIGTVDHVTVYPRELMSLALKHYASGLILVHNHPSGNAKPSRSDIEMTKKLTMIGEFFGITIVDHIIICSMNDYSFREHNLVFNNTLMNI